MVTASFMMSIAEVRVNCFEELDMSPMMCLCINNMVPEYQFLRDAR
jgi:hypothetical protein